MDVLALLERNDRDEIADNRMTFYSSGLGGKSIFYWNGSSNNFGDAFEGDECPLEIYDADDPQRRFHLAQRYFNSWRPDRIRSQYLTHLQINVIEEKTIYNDVFIDKITLSNQGEDVKSLLIILSGHPRGRAEINVGEDYIHVYEIEGSMRGIHKIFGFDQSSELKVEDGRYTASFISYLKPLSMKSFHLIASMSSGYDDALKKFRDALEAPDKYFDYRRREWRGFFDRSVPPFQCNDNLLTKLYYHCWYVCKCNVYRFNEGYFKYPFTSTGKFRLKPQWFWDTAFQAIAEKWMNGFIVGSGGIMNILEAQREDGHLPFTLAIDRFCFEETYGRIIQPWIIPVAIWDLYLKSGDRSLLEKSLDHLVKFDLWMERNRDPDGDGLVHLILPGESGWDNSKRFVLTKPFIQANSPMVKEKDWIEPPDFNTYVYLGRLLISRIAQEIGREELHREFRDKADSTLKSLQMMWDSKVNLYLDQFVDGHRRIDVKTPGGILPMFGGVPSMGQAEKLVSHLTDPEEFWRPFPVPSLSADDPDYTVEDTYESYWNGRAYPNVTWMIIEGLCRYGFYSVAGELTLKMLRVAVRRGEPYCTENYNPETGIPYIDPMNNIFCYGWGTLCNDLLIRRLLGIQPEAPRDRVHIKPLFPEELEYAVIDGVRIGLHEIGVKIRRGRKGLTVKLKHRGEKTLKIITPQGEFKVKNGTVKLTVADGPINHWLTL